MRGSAPRPAGGNNFPRSPLFCLEWMPKGRRKKGRRVRPSAHPPVPDSPPFLQRSAIIRRIPSRQVRRSIPVAFAVTFPTVAPPRLLRSPSPRFPPLHTFLGCSRSSASAIPQPRRSPSHFSAGPFRPPRLFPPAVSPQSLARAPAFPAAPSFLTHASRSFCDTLALRPPHALIPAFSGAPHRARPPLPQFSPSLPLSLPRRYFFSALFTNVEFLIDL